MSEFVVAAIQAAPIYFDRATTTDKACRLIAKASKKGAKLAAFGETWLPGYPFHAYASMTNALWYEVASLYIDQAVKIPMIS